MRPVRALPRLLLLHALARGYFVLQSIYVSRVEQPGFTGRLASYREMRNAASA